MVTLHSIGKQSWLYHLTSPLALDFFLYVFQVPSRFSFRELYGASQTTRNISHASWRVDTQTSQLACCYPFSLLLIAVFPLKCGQCCLHRCPWMLSLLSGNFNWSCVLITFQGQAQGREEVTSVALMTLTRSHTKMQSNKITINNKNYPSLNTGCSSNSGALEVQEWSLLRKSDL